MEDIKPGTCVMVNDPGLAMLRSAMERFEGKPFPNHVGRISRDEWDDPETYLVEFPIGKDPMDEHSQSAPYHKGLVVPLEETHPLFEYWKKP